MMEISLTDLVWVGDGANGKVYQYVKPLTVSGLKAVVKISSINRAKYAVENYALLKHAGVLLPAFMEECRVDGVSALFMEDLFSDRMVYVSPNSVRNGYTHNKPEAYLLENKLNGIKNIESLLIQMRDAVCCTNRKGIGLDMDMISFGVERGNNDSDVCYKLVDIDVMQHDDSMSYKLHEANIGEAKWAISLFVQYFVEGEDIREGLLLQINDFDW